MDSETPDCTVSGAIYEPTGLKLPVHKWLHHYLTELWHEHANRATIRPEAHRSTQTVPNWEELAQWLNRQAETPIGGLILFVLVYGTRLMIRDLLDRLPRKKKKRRKAGQHG